MEDRLDRGEAEDVNFYELNRGMPIGIEGAAGRKINIILIFSIVFLAFLVVLVISSIDSMFTSVESTIAPIMLLLVGGFFLVLGIRIGIQNGKKRTRENEILKDCTLTDGKIESYSCKEVVHHHNDRMTYTYEVKIVYSFFDTKLKRRNDTFIYTYSSNPWFHKGQNLMIGFNETDSMIFNRFSLVGSDKRKFREAEAGRSNDDFDGITGELERLDITKPIKNAEFTYAYFIAAACLLGLGVIYGVLIGIFALAPFLSSKNTVAIVMVIIFALALPLCFILIPAAIILGMGVKKQNHYKKVMKSEPRYTFGKLFASEKTYGNGNSKEILYCYIDNKGAKHTRVTKSAVLFQRVQDENIDVLVAYNKFGDSLILYDYAFLED